VQAQHARLAVGPDDQRSMGERDQFGVAALHRCGLGGAAELRHQRADGKTALGGVARGVQPYLGGSITLILGPGLEPDGAGFTGNTYTPVGMTAKRVLPSSDTFSRPDR
jgi:hypothetical protein